MNPPIEQFAAQISSDPDSTKQMAHAETSSSVDLRLLKHDLKNQLTTILCFCSLLRHSLADLQPKQVDYVDHIQASTKGILLLINGLGADDHSTDAAVHTPPDNAATD